jgi:hypothetical protein
MMHSPNSKFKRMLSIKKKPIGNNLLKKYKKNCEMNKFKDSKRK